MRNKLYFYPGFGLEMTMTSHGSNHTKLSDISQSGDISRGPVQKSCWEIVHGSSAICYKSNQMN